ncbi:two-component system, OmpR family, sensor histidine kinase CpxA [Abditibacterium utsteinense]|uniref:histidine kinase n=1 Tax=Abditibacterium utsteinense TaxID=1960156 RepID=A0A2S8SR00_9BACT|nr:ATP-binding protein [Abditibacterium utsteinense]PQV63220.1 two-component system, OmpR family, sensor histidine kinase CpxA [Abditibacterium utsteinense]
MQTLFGKIFLWFFFAQVLLGTAMFAVGFSQREASTPQPVRAMLGDELRWQSASAVLLARLGQLEKLEVKPSANGARTTIFWRPRAGKLAAIGKEPAPQVQALAHRAEKSATLQWMQSEELWGGAQASRLQNGTLVIVRQIPRRPHSLFGFLGDWKTKQGRVRLGISLVVMALVCYALARYITAPVARLRAATQRLTEGDLSVRVAFGARGDELIALGHDFDRMAARLEASTQSERRLLGDISHELRSPLARLSVALDLVEQTRARAQSRGETVPESTYLSAIERIQRESGRLNELIGQLLELTRLESLAEDALITPGVAKVALDGIVAEVVADAKFEARSHLCDVELLENQPCRLRGIEPLLHSAVENVVRNAVRYTAEATKVEVTLRRVEIKEAVFAVLTVRDHGLGVPEETLQDLFLPFYRVATGRDRQSGGVGLGLAIAQRALRVHGASIAARNVTGGGLEVEIRWPLPERQTVPETLSVDRDCNGESNL